MDYCVLTTSILRFFNLLTVTVFMNIYTLSSILISLLTTVVISSHVIMVIIQPLFTTIFLYAATCHNHLRVRLRFSLNINLKYWITTAYFNCHFQRDHNLELNSDNLKYANFLLTSRKKNLILSIKKNENLWMVCVNSWFYIGNKYGRF